MHSHGNGTFGFKSSMLCSGVNSYVVLLLYQICGIEWPESILRVVCNARATAPRQRVALLSPTDPCLKPAVKGELYGSGANGRLEPDPL